MFKNVAMFFVEVSANYPGCQAIDEMTILCGKCAKKISLNRMRYHQHFGVVCKLLFL